jgi:hypothetical protein
LVQEVKKGGHSKTGVWHTVKGSVIKKLTTKDIKGTKGGVISEFT